MIDKVVKDISLLYELSLNIGSSLNMHENCEAFLKVLMAKKNYSHIALWTFKRKEDDQHVFELEFALPKQHIGTNCFYSSIDIEKEFENKDSQIIHLPNLDNIVLSDLRKQKGYYALIKLSSTIFLEIYQNENIKSTLSEIDIKKLKNVLNKFSISIEACKNYEELKEARLKAQEATKTKSMFLANMSHEIRTPMNAVIGASELLKKTTLNQNQESYVKLINDAGTSLLAIINDVLDFSKIEANKLELDIREFSLNKMLDAINEYAQLKVSEKGIDFCILKNIQEDIIILSDEIRIKQIIINLVNNAIKFTSKGYVELQIKVINPKSSESNIEFRIVDTGKGISDQKKNSIFDAFNQEDNSITRVFGGTGLGLAIVSKLVQMLGGNISLKSKINEGSTFIISLPLKSIKNQDLKNFHKDEVTSLKTGLKILMAEDNIFNQKIAEAIFSNQEIEFDLVTNGKDAVEYVKTKQYDIILMDIQMPEMDGIEALKQIKNSFHITTPIIALTANALTGDKERIIELGFDSYISKPYNSKEVFEVINKLA